jgi:hypothetical protein
VNGSKVYGAWFEAGMGYRNDTTAGIAKGDEAETIYMLTSAIHYNDHCCFDYGNAEINVRDDGSRFLLFMLKRFVGLCCNVALFTSQRSGLA